ncbi:MAG TPA: class II fructose-bisphosphatase [Spirochaetota bacterium]|jgi:fructose-1,6-bisphosphatase II|nr:class II fructose-bisphosphatase [Spirochaetota bacterium]HOM87999.1 class II fructose-bisphosphatase [Spirochaetota bacterium]HOT19509.1 class II fructose-bisphosphatase [Spirochaetota bacterium]HPD04450.1 class II fructose-bisphosphatase [Spirochaetota bacterium]HQG41946.1 class II fructose-bisphosphatase [Spirochaetota bacterium]
MDRNLALEVVRVTEAAALWAARYYGRGNEDLAGKNAVEAMSKVFSTVSFKGHIICGIDNPDSSLCTGKIIGNAQHPEVDIALTPIDGHATLAQGGYNTISVIALAEYGSMLNAPPIYMEKIAVGKDARGVIDITQSPEVNIKRVARAKGKYIDDITVCILDRARHEELVSRIRALGARIKLIKDGDISGAVATALDDSPIDMLMGVGGAREGILSAAALKCLDGDMQARFIYRDEKDKELVRNMGITDIDKIYTLSDLAKGENIMFSATGISDGELLPGVRFMAGGAKTHSIVMRYKTHTIRYITAIHRFDYKPVY